MVNSCLRSIYLAASFPRRGEAKDLARLLISEGHTITSRWLDGLYASYGMSTIYSEMDQIDVARASTILVITGDTQTRGGRHSELGIALALGKECILFGPQEQVFHYNKCIKIISFQEDLLTFLRHNPYKPSVPSHTIPWPSDYPQHADDNPEAVDQRIACDVGQERYPRCDL